MRLADLSYAFFSGEPKIFACELLRKPADDGYGWIMLLILVD